MADFFGAWCDRADDEMIGKHVVKALSSKDDTTGIAAVVSMMPSVYADRDNLRRIAQRHKKRGVATLLANKMPTKKSARSGDMGEILGTIYVQQVMGYETGPSRLVERDHQEWAMRGDDVLGARLRNGKVDLIKVEAKSRSQARKSVITEAREGLKRNGDLASPHSLTQFAERLLKEDEDLSDAVNDLLQRNGIRPNLLSHVMFIFSGNHPVSHVRNDLKEYKGKVLQTTVSVRVSAHQEFIRRCYEAVVNDAT